MRSFVIALFICLFSVSSFAQQNSEIVKVGDNAPDFSFKDLSGKKATLAGLKGKTVMITFWATWCGPCRLELPEIQNKVWDVYKNNPNFTLLCFAREEDGAKVEQFKTSTGYTLPLIPDKKRAIFSKYATQTIPRNYIIDKSGKVIYASTGYNAVEFDKMVQLLENEMK